jgi:PAS domain S-box-containing protein
MGAQPEDPAGEIKRLQRCINDLVSVLALPAIWTGGELSQIVKALLEALLGMLRLDLIYVRLRDFPGDLPIEMARVSPTWEPMPQLTAVGEFLHTCLGDNPQLWPPVVRRPFGERDISIVPFRLGLQGEIGLLAVGSQRADFPQQTERLVLSVAANQAVIGLQGARLLSEQKHVASELDQRIAQRATELVAINDELRKEIVERKRQEEKLRLNEDALREAHMQVARSAERWRSIFENSAIGVALTDLSGRFIATNPVYQKMLGYSEEELQKLTFIDITQEEYRNPNRDLVGDLVAGKGRQFQIEKQYRRKDGSPVWVRNNVSVVPGTERVPRFLMALSEDITERKEAEEALRNSEQSFRLIVDGIAGLVAIMAATGEVESVNRQVLEYFGKATEDLKFWSNTDTVHPDDLPSVISAWKHSIETASTYDVDHRLRRADGVYRWFHARGLPLLDAEDRVVRWYVLLTDIDDRKRAEEQLLRSESFLAEGQRLSRTGSFSWRVETDEITSSDELYRIFGIEPGLPVTFDLIGSRVHPEDLGLLSDMIEKARGGISDFEYEHRLLMPDGSIKYVHLTAHQTRDKDGRLEYIGAAQDVTLRRRSEEALAEARSELANVSKVTSLGVLTASIAHEVNQPLSGIITNASTCLRMLNGDPPNIDGARETARRTIRDGNRASEVITRLRALFSKKAIAVEPVDLNEATRDVIALSLSDLQKNQVLLRPELADNLPLVAGDRVQLQQVILNLLRNASDAMSAVEDRPRHLVIRTERDEDDHVRLTVRDVGVGFDPQVMDKLFESFYTTKKDGMGVGLAVSRSIVENHHGCLWATANEGPGATFSFSIPCGAKGEPGSDATRKRGAMNSQQAFGNTC